MTKIATTSDVHSRPFQVPECDLLIIAGDLMTVGSMNELIEFNAFLGRNRHLYDQCIVTPGNHDKILERELPLAKTILTNAQILVDEPYTYAGLKIWASPWTPTFFNWYYMKDRGGDIRQVWDLIPDGLDILVTHGPPYGIMDVTDGRYGPPQSVGCEQLRKKLDTMEQPPRYHIFGHIHSGYGQVTIGDTTFINASLCDEDYKAVNPPHVFVATKD